MELLGQVRSRGSVTLRGEAGDRVPARHVALRSAALVALALLVLPVTQAHASAISVAGLIGVPQSYVTRGSDTLMDIAHWFDVGFVSLRSADPAVDPWLPGNGTALLLPTQHIVPEVPRRGIVINRAELRLYYFPSHGAAPLSFPVGIGDEGMATPTGATVVMRKARHPWWRPTRSERAEDPDLPAVVGPGPDNPMGDYALYLGWRGFAIHGTDNPDSIGRRDSHGCIRLYPEDIRKLYSLVTPGTPVRIIDQPVKTGWVGGRLYLEVDAGQDAADSIERSGRSDAAAPVDVGSLVANAAGSAASQIDWDVVRTAELRRDGIPRVVAKSLKVSASDVGRESNRKCWLARAIAGQLASPHRSQRPWSSF